MRKDLMNQQQLLVHFMSSISERCFQAGWMQNLEYILWDVLYNGERQYGHGMISQQDINALQSLPEAAHTWIIYNNEVEEIAIALNTWKRKFQNDIEQNSELLKS